MFELLTLHPPAFGLDISDLSFKFVYLKKAGKKVSIAAFGEHAIPEGVVVEGEVKKEEALVSLLQAYFKSQAAKKVRTPYVVASLPEQKAFLQVIQLPKMDSQDLGVAASFQAENYIPYPVDTVYIDSQFIEPLKDSFNHADVLLASLPKATVDSYVSCLAKAGLVPRVLEIESLAVARALIPKGVSFVPLLLVDLGATRTTFLIFAGRSLRFTASVPIGSAQFTLEISQGLHLPLSKGEQLKKKYGLSKNGAKQGATVFAALSPVAEAVAGHIQKYIDYYASHALHQHLQKEERQVQKVVLAGGGANLLGLPEFLEKTLKVQVEIGDPWINVMKESSRDIPALPLTDALRYTTALGLALRGLAISHD